VQGILKSSRNTVSVLNAKGEVVNPAHPKTAPDVILVQGTLSSGAVASIAFRKPTEAVDNVGFRWLITGTEGEIEVTSAQAQWQMADPSFKLRVKVGKGVEAREVDFRAGGDARLSALLPRAINTARSYAAFAKGDETRYATFESALKTKKLLDRILESAQRKE
jgi:predicted dehydrogenase